MLVICPECHKKLNVPETIAGKKVRCPGCKGVVAVPGPSVAATLPRAGGRPDSLGSRSPLKGDVTAPPEAAMRCAACKAAALQALPANQFSRHPGYVCTGCGAIMRPPGSTGTYVFVMILGSLVVLLGILLAVVALGAEQFRGRMIFGGLSLAGLGAVVAGWGFKQSRLPTPLDAPARPSRLWLWLIVLLVVLLAVAGGVFGFLYFLHEML